MSALITFVALLCAAPSALAVKLINVEALTREEVLANAAAMPCLPKSQRLGTFMNGCSSLTGLSAGCGVPDDVCYVKDGGHSQCRPINRHLPSLWPTVKAIFCEGESLPAIPEGPAKGRPREPGLQKPHGTALAVHAKTKGKAKKGHNHAKDHGPIPPGHEGNNCVKADMDAGCECAGRFWRCGDRENLIAKACDEGLECVRKNAFYAVCATPARKQWAVDVDGWEGTAVPCGMDIGKYRAN